MIGQAVSHYRVLRELGGGGMGVVYEAEDTRLGRMVALKFMTEERLPEGAARERFVREARTASRLNHPNICTVFDVGEHEGRPFIAMERLDGMTLGNRIHGEAIGTDELLHWAIQVADALDVMHAHGIIHRDIKPGNVFITVRGEAKILDFGIARVEADVPSADPDRETATAAPRLTDPGFAPGTRAYMSPEQALGKDLDGRTDLFSLGIVLHEMATGERPFGDEWPSSPVRLSSRLPDDLGRIVRKCLETDRALRYQSARELVADLRRAERDRSSGPSAPSADGRSGSHPRRRLLLGAGAAIALGGSLWLLWRASPPHPAPRIVPLTTDGGLKLTPRLSPDGDRIAYAWTGPADDNWDIYVRAIGPGARPLRLTDGAASEFSPVWSPDGREIAFLRESGAPAAGSGPDMVRTFWIYTVPSLGGQERKLVAFTGPAYAGTGPTFSWSPDGRWLAVEELPESGPSRIVRVDLSTLERTPLTSPPADSGGDSASAISPDGRTLAFVRGASRSYGNKDLWLQPVAGGAARQLTFGSYDMCCDVTWTERGDALVFATGSRAVPGSIFRVASSGGAPALVQGIGQDVLSPTAGGDRLVFAQYVRRTPAEIWRTPGRKAPPGRRTSERLIFSSQNDCCGHYSPDGRRIVFESLRSGSDNIWAIDSDGKNPVQLTSYASHSGSPSWSPDGHRIAFDSRESGNPDVYVVDAEGGVPRRLTREPSEEINPSFSRDGRFVYFSSDRSGRAETWRVPADGGPAVQVTHGGGGPGEESWDGRYFYYTRGRTGPGDAEGSVVWRVPVAGGAEEAVLQGPFNGNQWTVARTGLYYATMRWTLTLRRTEATVLFFDLQSGHSSPIFTQVGPFFRSFVSVSPDEEWVLRHQHSLPQSELMLVENFR